jgi:hypothetical protein
MMDSSGGRGTGEEREGAEPNSGFYNNTVENLPRAHPK